MLNLLTNCLIGFAVQFNNLTFQATVLKKICFSTYQAGT